MTKKCEQHGDYEAKYLSAWGSKKYYSFCPACEDETSKMLAEREESEERERIKGLKSSIVSQSCIPKRFLKSDLTGYSAETITQKFALSVAEQYLKMFGSRKYEGCSLVFCGKPGTGKTHIACAIANSLIENLVSVKYSSVYSAVREVKSTYSKDSTHTEKDVIRSFVGPSLLILDEVGVQFGTPSDILIMYQILNGRYEEVLPTILISNLTKEELTDFIGERSVDRMREGGGAVVSFDWESHRK